MREQVSMGKKLTFRLDTALVERLELHADHERVPVSYLLRHLVLRFLGCKTENALQALATPVLWGSAGSESTSGAAVTRGEGAELPPIGGAGRRSAPSLDMVAKRQAEFLAEVCALFDGFRGQGLDARESAKRTNFALKAKNHPWATYEVVADLIRKTGRFRKAKGVRS